MKFCNKCNAPIGEGEMFCSNCGAAVEGADSEYNDGFQRTEEKSDDYSVLKHSDDSGEDNNIYSHSAPERTGEDLNSAQDGRYIKKVCPNCNQPLDRGQRVCSYCGYDVARYNDDYDSPIEGEYKPARSPYSAPGTPSAKKSNKTPIIIGVICALAVIAAVIILFVVFSNQKSGSKTPTDPSGTAAVTESVPETEPQTEPEVTQAPETEAPTEAPTDPPTEAPTEPPTEAPTEAPTEPQPEEPTYEPEPEDTTTFDDSNLIFD